MLTEVKENFWNAAPSQAQGPGTVCIYNTTYGFIEGRGMHVHVHVTRPPGKIPNLG